MQQWWFEGGLGLKPTYLWCFYDFPLNGRFSLIFMNMQITLLVNIFTKTDTAVKGDITLQYIQNISNTTIHTSHLCKQFNDHFSFVCHSH